MPDRALTKPPAVEVPAVLPGPGVIDFFLPSFLLELGDFRASWVERPGASDRACARLAVDARCEVEPRLPVAGIERYRRTEARLRPRCVALLEPCRAQRLKRNSRPGH